MSKAFTGYLGDRQNKAPECNISLHMSNESLNYLELAPSINKVHPTSDLIETSWESHLTSSKIISFNNFWAKNYPLYYTVKHMKKKSFAQKNETCPDTCLRFHISQW